MAETNTSNIGFEKQICDAACVLRGNIDASEYKSVVLGLIFLKYISDRFEAKYQELVAEGDGFEEDKDHKRVDRSAIPITCIFICNTKKTPDMRPIKIVNACVHNLLIGKALIKFDVIMQVSFGIIFTKLLCQILCQARNQTSTVLCTFTAAQFLLYNAFAYIPIGKQHCLTGSTISSLLSRGNNTFNFCNN